MPKFVHGERQIDKSWLKKRLVYFGKLKLYNNI